MLSDSFFSMFGGEKKYGGLTGIQNENMYVNRSVRRDANKQVSEQIDEQNKNNREKDDENSFFFKVEIS